MDELIQLLTLISITIGIIAALYAFAKWAKEPATDVWDGVRGLIYRLKEKIIPNPTIIKESGVVMGGSCEIKGVSCISPHGEKPVTQVFTASGQRINVCNPCLEFNKKSKKWLLQKT